MLHFVMLAFLRKENYGIFGMKEGQTLSDEEKMELLAFRSIEQENALRRDFIIHALSQASDDCLKSKLLLEFAAMHFSDKVVEIKGQCNEACRKKHERIQERILQLQPYNSENAEEAATGTEEQPAAALPAPEPAVTEGEETPAPEPETFENPDMDDMPLYPGLPEQAQIDEAPDDDGEIMEAVHEGIAA